MPLLDNTPIPDDTREDFNGESHAIYSNCENYRYFLSRIWNAGDPLLMFIMLNPSKATVFESDRTVTWCKRRTEQEVIYGGVCILNIFALWGTSPERLGEVECPIGSKNDEIIRRQVGAIRNIDKIVCAWGDNGEINGRGNRVEDTLREITNFPLYCLDTSLKHYPMHPRGIRYKYEKELELFEDRATRIR